MTNILLIVILVAVLVIMVSSILTTILVVKQNKAEKLAKKVLKIAGIVLIVAIVVALAVFASTKSVKGENTGNTTTQETTSELDEAGFNKVTLDEYMDLIKSPEKTIILVARPTCGYCQQFTPILKQAMEDMNLTVNYIDTDTLSEDDWATFEDSLDFLKTESWGTPLTLIVKDGKVVDNNNGYVDLETIKEFFTKNELGE